MGDREDDNTILIVIVSIVYSIYIAIALVSVIIMTLLVQADIKEVIP